jgi:hypothetical protein
VAIFAIIGSFLFIFFNDPDIFIYVMVTLMTILVLFPLLFRYSRVVYLHVFGGIRYNPDVQKSRN